MRFEQGGQGADDHVLALAFDHATETEEDWRIGWERGDGEVRWIDGREDDAEAAGSGEAGDGFAEDAFGFVADGDGAVGGAEGAEHPSTPIGALPAVFEKVIPVGHEDGPGGGSGEPAQGWEGVGMPGGGEDGVKGRLASEQGEAEVGEEVFGVAILEVGGAQDGAGEGGVVVRVAGELARGEDGEIVPELGEPVGEFAGPGGDTAIPKGKVRSEEQDAHGAGRGWRRSGFSDEAKVAEVTGVGRGAVQWNQLVGSEEGDQIAKGAETFVGLDDQGSGVFQDFGPRGKGGEFDAFDIEFEEVDLAEFLFGTDAVEGGDGDCFPGVG